MKFQVSYHYNNFVCNNPKAWRAAYRDLLTGTCLQGPAYRSATSWLKTLSLSFHQYLTLWSSNRSPQSILLKQMNKYNLLKSFFPFLFILCKQLAISLSLTISAHSLKKPCSSAHRNLDSSYYPSFLTHCSWEKSGKGTLSDAWDIARGDGITENSW